MLYDLTLTLENTYRGNTDTARNVIRMLPLTLPNHQELIAGRIDINPAPD